MFCIGKIKVYVSWFPSLDSCMTKVGGVNMELQWREMNSSTPPEGLTTKACQSALIKQIHGELFQQAPIQ